MRGKLEEVLGDQKNKKEGDEDQERGENLEEEKSDFNSLISG